MAVLQGESMVLLFKHVLHRACLVGVMGAGLAWGFSAAAAIPIEHWTQPSGAQVYFVASPAIPMVDVQIDFDAGARRDPAGQAGLARVTADMSSAGVLAGRTGQEPALDENALSEAWVDTGASFSASAGADSMGFSLRSLTDPALLARAVHLAARQMGQPAFPDTVWLREREGMQAALREAATRPATIARRSFSAAVFGDHPYGVETTEASLAAIAVADMRRFYANTIRSCRAKVSVVGALSRAQADAMVTQLLAELPSTGTMAACAPLPAVAEVRPLAQAQDLRLSFPSAAQAQVLLGQPGIRRNDPDYFALTVGNYILGGGGFVSRLTEEVRQKRGLSYSVYSYFAPALHAGAFTIGLQTRPDQAAQAVAVTREVLERFLREGPTQAELDDAKANLIGGFALRLDSNAKLLANVSNIAWNGLPLDYLDTWTAQVDKLTLEDIRRAFARVLDPQRMVTVVVGP